MRRHEKPPVKLAHLLLVAAWSGRESSSATPEQAAQIFNDAKPDTQRMLERFAAVTERRYRVGAMNLKIISRMGDFAVGSVLACIAVLAWVHWPWAIMFALGVLNGAAVMSIAAYIGNAQPFTMDDLP